MKSNKTMNLLLCLIAILFILGCATSRIKIDTKPDGVQIYLYDEETKKEKKLESAPQKPIAMSDLRDAAGSNDFAILKLIKFGYLPSFVLIPTSWDMSGTVSLALTKVDAPYLKELARKDYIDKLSKIVFDFLKIQTAIENDEVELAKKLIENIDRDYGEISPFFVLKANYFFKIKDYPNALLYYQKAFALYPKEEQLKQAIINLENMRKGH